MRKTKLWMAFLSVSVAIVAVVAFWSFSRTQEKGKSRAVDLEEEVLKAPPTLRRVETPVIPRSSELHCVSGSVQADAAPFTGAFVHLANAESPQMSARCPCSVEVVSCGCAEGQVWLDDLRKGFPPAITDVSTRTDAQGNFQLCFSNSIKKAVIWSVSEDGQRHSGYSQVESFEESLAFELLPLRLYEGRVQNESHQSLENIDVFAMDARSPVEVWHTKSGKNGVFQIKSPGGSSLLFFGQSSSLVLSSSSDEVVVATMSPPHAVHVRVFHEGKPVSQAQVSVDDMIPINTDADGWARFPEVPLGAFRILAKHGELHGELEQVKRHLGRQTTLAISIHETEKESVEEERVNAKVCGHARDERGRPLGQATVQTNQMSVDFEGDFCIELPIGEQSITVTSGACVATHKNFLLQKQGATLDFELECEVSFAGTVVDERGKPISGAVLDLNSERTETNAQGQFSLVVSKGKESVWVSKEGFLEKSESVEIPNLNFTIVLRDALQMTGRVIDQKGEPVRGSRIDVIREENLSQPIFSSSGPSDNTSDDGRFELEVPRGSFIVIVGGDRFGPIRMEKPEDGKNLKFQLRQERTIEISGVVSNEEGQPIAVAQFISTVILKVHRMSTESFIDSICGDPAQLLKGRSSKADGSFTFNVCEIETDFLVEAEGYEPKILKVSGSGRYDVQLRRKPKQLVKGSVVDARSEPVRRFKVEGYEFYSETGHFQIEYPKEKRLEISTDGAWVSVPLPETANENVDVGSIVLSIGGGEVEIGVTDSRMRPVSSATVSVRHAKYSSSECRTDVAGKCRLNSLKAGPIQVEIYHPDFAIIREDLNLEESTKHLSFRFTKSPPGISGTCVPFSTLRLNGTENTLCSPEGTFEFSKVRAGTHSIVMELNTQEEVGLRREVAGEPIRADFRMGLEGSLEGNLLDSKSSVNPVETVVALRGAVARPMIIDCSSFLSFTCSSDMSDFLQLSDQALSTKVHQGTFRLTQLPPGNWTLYGVFALQPKGEIHPIAQVSLSPGESKRLNVEIP